MQKTYNFKKFLFIGIFITALIIFAVMAIAPKISYNNAKALVWDGSSASAFGGGDGTSGSPYQIANGNQLAYFADNVNSGEDYYDFYFILTENIELNDVTYFFDWENNPPSNVWAPIGRYELGAQYPFRGHFEGNGKTISGLYVNKDEYSGLFGYLGSNGGVYNLILENSFVGANYRAGVLAGYINNAFIDYCSISGVIIGKDLGEEEPIFSSVLGGLCGFSESSNITNCYSDVNIFGGSSIGGLIGEFSNGMMYNCENEGYIIAENSFIGGLVGINGGVVGECLNFGNVSGNNVVGGLVGENASSGSVYNSLMLGSVTASEDNLVGMLIGNNNGTLEDSFFNIEKGAFAAIGGTSDFSSGRERIEIVDIDFQDDLGMSWTYTPKSGNTYYYPSINGRFHSFDAYRITLYSEGIIYKEILFDEGEYTLLPVIAVDGYTISWQTEDEDNDWGSTVTGLNPASDTTLYLRKILNAPEVLLLSSDIDIVFDGETHSLQAEATFDAQDADIIFQWYYSATENGEYELIPDTDSSQCFVRNHSDSGFYKCGAYLVDGEYISEEIFTEPIEVIIAKASISEGSVPALEVLFGVYNPNKTLADYSLPTNFYWTNINTVPSCVRNYSGGIDDGYSAYYNPDLDNYISYELTAYINLDKANYIGITHYSFAGTYSSTQTLADFSLDSNYYWVNENTVPTVNITQYNAIYNADSTNYNDFSLTVTINLTKASYAGITHIALYGEYDVDKTLADYSLFNSFYRWEDPDIVPDILVTSYNALYNADSDNYNDFSLTISLTLTKATPQVTVDYDKISKIFIDGSLPAISVDTSDVEGTVAWEEYTLIAGTNAYYWLFTPVDTVRYKTLRGGEQIVVLTLDLISIAISTPPTTTNYYAFNIVDTDGMTVYAYFNDDRSEEILTYTIEYENGSSLIYGDTKFYVVYQFGETIKQAEQSVTVNKIEVEIPTLTQDYYYNGESQNHNLSDTDFYSVSTDSYINAGTYYITISLFDKDNYRWEGSDSDDKNVTWVINKKIVTAPSILGSYEYNGLLQQANIALSNYYTIYNNLQKNSGTYNVIVELINKSNLCWNGGSSEDLSLSWTIEKYVVDIPVSTEASFVYDKTPHKVAITPGLVYGIFNDTQTNAGDYNAEVVLKDKNNYRWINGSSENLYYPYQIAKREVLLPIFSGEYVYNGLKQKANIYPDNEWYIISGDEQTNAGSYLVTVAIDAANCIWAGGGSEIKTFDFVIEKLKINKPIISGNYVYNGEEQVVDFVFDEYYSVNEEELTFINAGSYRIFVTLIDENNTQWTDGGDRIANIDYVVAKKAVQRVVYQPATFTYSGAEITYMPVSDTFLYVITNNKKTVVGNYTATIQLKYTENYKWSDDNVQATNAAWSIVPQAVEKPTLAKNNKYLGYEQTAAIPEDARYAVSGNKATNAGTYTATISLVDTNNYIWSDSTTVSFSITWQILKATVEKPNAGSNLIYNGITQKYILTENDAYTISGNTAKDGGNYTAVVSLINTNNFEWSDGTIGNLSYNWKIYYVKAESEEGDNYITAFGSDGKLFSPIKEGYVFEGWYLNSDFSGEMITNIADIDDDVILFPKWRKNVRVDDIVVNPKRTLSTKAIVGISVGGVLTLLAVVIIIYAFTKKKY